MLSLAKTRLKGKFSKAKEMPFWRSRYDRLRLFSGNVQTFFFPVTRSRVLNHRVKCSKSVTSNILQSLQGEFRRPECKIFIRDISPGSIL